MIERGINRLFLKFCNYPTGPLVLGLPQGKTIESNMRRALTLSKGDWSVFLTQPIFCVILVLVVAAFCLRFLMYAMKKRMREKKGA